MEEVYRIWLTVRLLIVGVDSEALKKDAQYYAEDFGVNVDEALRRLKLQEVIGVLSYRLSTEEAVSFGGLYVEHKPSFHIVALFTGNVGNS